MEVAIDCGSETLEEQKKHTINHYALRKNQQTFNGYVLPIYVSFCFMSFLCKIGSTGATKISDIEVKPRSI